MVAQRTAECSRRWGWSVFFLAATLAILPGAAFAQTLIDSPFLTSYDGWTNTYDYSFAPQQGSYPSWGVLLEKGTLMENSDGIAVRGGTYDAGVENNGAYKPYMMVNSATTSSTYTLTGTYSSWDDDGLGIIFGYQDNDNYFRLGLRRQATGAYGFNQGLHVSKVVNGVITPFLAGPSTSFVNLMNDTPFSLEVNVDGGQFEVYAWRPEGGRKPSTPQISGFDADLATMGAGQYGTMSWGNKYYSDAGAYRAWGVQLHSMTVDNGSNGTIDKNHAFDSLPVTWRKLSMTNSLNLQETHLVQQGNFQLDFTQGVIQDNTNGYEWATSATPNTDFIGPAVVVNTPGAENIGNMEMKVRIECEDNEGPGLLVRVQDDKTFYRINFATEATGSSVSRARQGLSIQKCLDNGEGVAPTWTQLFYETTPQFLYKGGAGTSVPFDVIVRVVNNGTTSTTIQVEVPDPDGLSDPYMYTATDYSNPLLTGTVGFTNWGGAPLSATPVLYPAGVLWSGFGGDPNAPLVVAYSLGEAAGGVPVPEPGTVAMLLGAAAALVMVRRRRMIVLLLAAWCFAVPMAGATEAATLVGSPFITGYDGWTDPYTGTLWVGDSLPMWGVLVSNNALCEVSNGSQTNGGTYDGGSAGDSQYKPWLLVNTNYTTPSKYTLTGTLSATDDDGLGLVFGYQDSNNYFRIGMRSQTNANHGFATGISLDKVVNGVITQVAYPDSVNFSYLTDNTPFQLKVEVDGTICKVTGPSLLGGIPTTYFNGSIGELATMGQGHYGMMSWLSRFDTGDATKRPFGAQLHSLAVDNNSDGSIDKNHTFENVSPLPWRELYMTNAAGVQNALEYDKGNFRIELTKQGIVDDTNPYVNATTTAPNADFLGAAIVIDDAATLSLSDYQMQVRMECGDDEGPGLLVRVQDDNTFYRINFTAEATGTGEARPPQGMSIQKCDGRAGGNPVWTELFRETSDPFIYTNHTAHGETFPFDVKVSVTNNPADTAATIRVEVIDDPEELATSHVWEVVDSVDPILTGTVGLTNWAAGNLGFGRSIGVRWSGYGGDVSAPLVVEATAIAKIPGDANGDGNVDDADAKALALNWGGTGGWAQGDFNYDNTIDARDAAILAANFGYVSPVLGGQEATAVPEPGSLALLVTVAATLIAMRRRA
ncbi:MAG TPA: hypothetical protein DD670_08805 [Planctomycetaceae bacterium]|nr:hypothetical protein [Planctomycetaceae bacterium]